MANDLYRAWLTALLSQKSKNQKETAGRIKDDGRATVVQYILDNPFLNPESPEDHILAALDRVCEKNPHLFKPKPPDFSKMTADKRLEWANENIAVKRETPEK